MRGRGLLRPLVLGLVVILVVATAVWWAFLRPANTKVTAYFGTTVGIYPGTEVRVLGVKMGTVDSVEPEGDQVKVVLSLDPGVPLPADAKAAAVAPTVVADRYIQMLPTYTSGPKLADNDVIPRNRTATPVELDELSKSLEKTATALGPEGANANGALTDLLNTGAANLQGNGEALGATFDQLSLAVSTLANSRGDLFSTVDNLQTFVTTLAANDAQVQQFAQQLASFSGFLASERTDLGLALQQLSVALGDVATFVRDNRQSLSSNLDGLSAVTGVLAKQRGALAEVLDTAPIAATNLINAYNAGSGTLDTRLNFNELSNPGLLICNLIQPSRLAPGNPIFDSLRGNVAPITDYCKTIADGQGGKLVVPTPHFLEVDGAAGPPAAPALPLVGGQ